MLLMVSSLRIGAFLVASPFFGSRMIPLQVRIVFSIALGIGIMSHVEFPSFNILTGASLLPIIFQEVLVGLACKKLAISSFTLSTTQFGFASLTLRAV